MPPFHRIRHLVATLALLALAVLPCWTPPLSAALPALPGSPAAATVVAAAPAESLTAESVAAARAALEKEIATTRTELSQLAETGTEAAALRLTQETALLERIDAVHAEQQRTLQHAADLAKEAAEVAELTRSRRSPEATLRPPLGLALLDQLYGERDYLAQAVIALKRDIDNVETALREARDTLQAKDRLRRAARDAAGTAKAASDAQGNLRLAELESRLAHETVRLNEQALRTLQLQQSLLAPKQQLWRPRFDWLRAHLSVSDDEIASLRQRQEKRAAELDHAIAAAKKDAAGAAQAAAATERRTPGERTSDELESRRASRQTANLTLSVLTAQRERLAEEQLVAELRRRVLAGGMSSKELRTLAEKNEEAIDQLARARRQEASALYRGRRELQDWQNRLTRATAADERSPAWSVERAKRLSAWIDLSEADVADVDRLRTARSRLQEEIGGHVSLFSWRDLTTRVGEDALAAWSYEIFAVQDQPVRVKTIVAVLLLVAFGHRAARWLSALLSRTLLQRLGMNAGRRAASQTLWFYALFLGVLLVASNLFHISLTQFSVVSGALAVGIGFGSQNLIGNFISGIILLLERPVNQGDVIEIDGLEVTVERLGPRSTIVRTRDNTHMIVPNSRLLEQPVINWTLSDDVVRRRISVGVAYESPTRQVAELLQGVLASVEQVRKEPAPLVMFADFGESSLLFEVFFWVNLSDRLSAENELRHGIAAAFAREKIVMAFPQRDVHLETTKPLQVVINPPPGAPADTHVPP